MDRKERREGMRDDRRTGVGRESTNIAEHSQY
jgi:hypothetical protein